MEEGRGGGRGRERALNSNLRPREERGGVRPLFASSSRSRLHGSFSNSLICKSREYARLYALFLRNREKGVEAAKGSG